MFHVRKGAYLLFVLGTVFSMFLTSCGALNLGKPETIKIGAIFDLSGPTADVSKLYAEGIKMYVEWKNANGGINGRPIELLSADYGYEVAKAEVLYDEFVTQGVVAFIGWGTGDTEALRGKVAADKIPFMSGSFAEMLVDINAAPYNFMVGVSYSDQAKIALRWILADWESLGKPGAPRVVMAHQDGPFGRSPLGAAQQFAQEHSMEFLAVPMPTDATDFDAELARIEQFGANYVIVQHVASPAATLVKNAARSGMTKKMQFVMMNWCADELFVSLVGNDAEDIVGLIPFTPPSDPIPGHHGADVWLGTQGSGIDQKSLHFVQGWWTIAVMIEGIQRIMDRGEEVSGEGLRASLEGIANYSTGGVTATISFSPTNHKGTNALRLYRVKDGRWTRISSFIPAE